MAEDLTELMDDLRQMGKLCEVYSPDQCATMIDGIGWIAARHKLNRAADELEALRKRCEAVEADAERYRWLRAMAHKVISWDYMPPCPEGFDPLYNGYSISLDATIDQAIAAAQEPSHG